jgi:integrase
VGSGTWYPSRPRSRRRSSHSHRWFKRPRCSPEILSRSEIGRLLAATDSPKYRAIFMLAYGAGLRVSEITSLFTSDIDSERMLIYVRDYPFDVGIPIVSARRHHTGAAAGTMDPWQRQEASASR